ncbi:hypothetical protein [Hymenobacter ruber]
MKPLYIICLCASALLLGSCNKGSQDPVPVSSAPRIAVRYVVDGIDTTFTLVQIRTYPHAKPDSTAFYKIQAMMRFFGPHDWLVHKLPPGYDLTASLLVPPCGSRRKVMPPGASYTLEILVNERVRKSVKITAGSTIYTPPVQTDIRLQSTEL